MRVNSFSNMMAVYQASPQKQPQEADGQGPEDSFKPSSPDPDPAPVDYQAKALGAASEALTGTAVAGLLGALTRDPKVALGMAGVGFVAGAAIGWFND